MQRWKRGFAAVAALALGVFFTSSAAVNAVAEPAQPEAADDAGVVAESDDIRALVAPVALYPDPILALVLQASTLPLEVVQAERFLDKREKDPKLEPDADWDKSIIALLNYPRLVHSMSEYIDWTEELGDAVVDDLDAVQSAVQEIRLGAFHAGFLKSNDRQKVELKDDAVHITSTDPKKVSIPQYDPAALLTTLDEVEEAEDAADEAAAAPAAPSSKPTGAAAKQPAAPAAPAPQPAPAKTAAPPATAAGTVAPAAYVAEPVAPPVIAYGEPEDSFWGDAATFAGGAVVGGLLGWGLTEAFDDDDDDWWDGDGDWDSDDVQDELRERREFRENRRDDVLAARDDRRADRQAGADARREDRQQARVDRGESRDDRAARARQQLNERPEATGGRTKPASAGSARAGAQQARAERGKREVKLPGAGTQAGAADTVRQRSAATTRTQAGGKPAAAKLDSAKQKRAAGSAGYAAKRDGEGIAASTGNYKQVRNDAHRGAQSRVAHGGGGQPRAMPASVSRGGAGGDREFAHQGGGGDRTLAQRGSGGGIAADRHRGGFAADDGARGRASRGGGGGLGGGGRGGGGRGRR